MSALSSMAMDGVKRVPGGASGKVVEMGEGTPGTLESYRRRPLYNLQHLSDI